MLLFYIDKYDKAIRILGTNFLFIFLSSTVPSGTVDVGERVIFLTAGYFEDK